MQVVVSSRSNACKSTEKVAGLSGLLRAVERVNAAIPRPQAL